MPELVEVLHMSENITKWCKDEPYRRIITTEDKNPYNPVLTAPQRPFFISATSYGKELRLTLTDVEDKTISTNLVMGMGMAGSWIKCRSDKQIDNSQLNFQTDDGSSSLHFVDRRRFGRWKWGDFSPDRGPDPLRDFDKFCLHIRSSFERRIFDKPICELLLDQKYFNGIGNYLRAEILDRVGVEPFNPARKVLENVVRKIEDDVIRGEKEGFLKGETNILTMCRDIPQEVIDLGLKDGNKGYHNFQNWLRCYGKSNFIKDGTGRTIWYRNGLGKTEKLENIQKIPRVKLPKNSEKSSQSVMPKRLMSTTHKFCALALRCI